MAELSEEQLLLLNNLMYYEGAATSGSTVEDIAKKLLVVASNYDKDSQTLSGGFESNPDQMLDIAIAILQDDTLCNLTVTDSVNTDGVRASCFVDTNGEATIAVRGTGGSYEAWSDNVEGAYGIGTACQEELRKFVKEQGEYYNNITITGHSKGGNMAQYATVLGGDTIDRCVSFDGQGFNDEFCEQYKDEIGANQDKIKSICGESDYVSILLNPIAGEIVYLETTKGENPHSSYALWERNKGIMTNGEYSNTVEQAKWAQSAKEMIDGLVDKLGTLPESEQRSIYDCLAALAGLGFANSSGQLTDADIQDALGRFERLFSQLWGGSGVAMSGATGAVGHNLTDAIEKIRDRIIDRNLGYGGSACQFGVNYSQLDNIADDLRQYTNDMACLIEQLDDIRLTGSPLDRLNSRINKMEREMENQRKELRSMYRALMNIQEMYEKTELRICVNIK